MENKKISLSMIILCWLIVFAFGTYFLEKKLLEHQPELKIEQDTPTIKQVSIKLNNHNQYMLPGKINNIDVIFLIDTGATHVSIPYHIAKQIQVRQGPETEIQTASGTDTGYHARIDSLTIGNIHLENIRATITPQTDEDYCLLGMSALKRLEMTQEQGKLIIKQKLNN